MADQPSKEAKIKRVEKPAKVEDPAADAAAALSGRKDASGSPKPTPQMEVAAEVQPTDEQLAKADAFAKANLTHGSEGRASRECRPVYATVNILPSFIPGDRLDEHFTEDQIRLLLESGDGSYDRPKGE